MKMGAIAPTDGKTGVQAAAGMRRISEIRVLGWDRAEFLGEDDNTWIGS
jgi:hypothetical protein